MIQRLNFYDFYGYLVPGMVFITILWLPFGLLSGTLPAGSWTSAVMGLVIAYVAGHVLQLLARAFPQAKPYPSIILLDADDPTLSADIKDRLYELIEHQFRIDVRGWSDDDLELQGRRQDTFLLCRAALIQSEVGSYAEQFQGMYTLMRGLAVALVLGATYHWGWGTGGLLSSEKASFVLWGVVTVLSVLSLAALRDLISNQTPSGWLQRLFREPWWLWVTCCVSFLIGLSISGQHPQASANAGSMFGIGAGALLVAYLCHRSYGRFATHFASSVYRDFFALRESPDERREM